MKILFVINGLGTGGSERSLAEMLPGFVDAGIEPTVVCLDRRDIGVQDQIRALGIDVRFLQCRGWESRIRELRAVASRVRPDLVHTTIFEADVLGRLASVGTSSPVLTSLVSTPYDPVRLQDPNIRRWRLNAVRILDGWSARRLTAHFHAVSCAAKEAAVRDLRIDPATVTVVPRGRDPRRLGAPSADRRSLARRNLRLDPAEFVLLAVGRQEFAKGQWNLVEAMPQILATNPAARLMVAGRLGNASRRIDDVARSTSLNGQVRFLGHRDDLPDILAAADLFVFPSLYEGLPGALIEAMALGLPIVASDLPAIREVVEADRSALLVPRGSSSALAAAVSTLVTDPDRRRAMGERGRQIFEERFTLEKSTARMVELFQVVAANGRH